MIINLISLLHLSLGLRSLYLCCKLNRLRFVPEISKYNASALLRFLSYNIATVYAKVSLGYGIWNIVMAFMWLLMGHTYLLSPAGYVLWPSLCVLFSTVLDIIYGHIIMQVRVSKMGGSK